MRQVSAFGAPGAAGRREPRAHSCEGRVLVAQKITPHALLTTAAVRADSIRYGLALEVFATVR